jgi:hypothetical protein
MSAVPSSTTLRALVAPPGPCLRASGLAGASRAEAPVIARGTHRTRVSEMRRAGVPAAAWRPERSGARRLAPLASMARDGEDVVHQGTG